MHRSIQWHYKHNKSKPRETKTRRAGLLKAVRQRDITLNRVRKSESSSLLRRLYFIDKSDRIRYPSLLDSYMFGVKMGSEFSRVNLKLLSAPQLCVLTICRSHDPEICHYHLVCLNSAQFLKQSLKSLPPLNT